MSTAANNPSVTPSGNPPANPAKGNQRGQTTLVAEIARWQTLVNTVAPQISQFPGLTEQLTQFQTLLVQAHALNDQLTTLKGTLAMAFDQRKQMLADGADLFSRMSQGLKSAHGSSNAALRQYGLKPRKKRISKSSQSTPPPPQVEVVATAPKPPAVAAAPAPAPAPAAVPAKE